MKNLSKVSFTGLDAQTDVVLAVELAKFCSVNVEYGLLASHHSAGNQNRYMEIATLKDVAAYLIDCDVEVVLHVCGIWSRWLMKICSVRTRG